MRRDEYFLQMMGESVLLFLLRIVREGYRTSVSVADTVLDQGPEGPDAFGMIPWVRRAYIERGLGLAVLEFPNHLVEEIERTGSCNTHTLSTNAGEVHLQQYRGLDEHPYVRPSISRRCRAQNNVPTLFDDGRSSEEPGLFALLEHGSEAGATEPAFVMIRFPTPELGLHPEFIDLFDLERSLRESEDDKDASPPPADFGPIDVRLRQADDEEEKGIA